MFLLLPLKSRQKASFAFPSEGLNMENETNFSSLELTPSFAYETDKIQGNGHLEILVWAYRYRHRNRHVNITAVFYTV